MSQYKVTRAILHSSLQMVNVKTFGTSLHSGEYVANINAKLNLELEGDFLKVSIGKYVEIIPLSNVASMTVVQVEANSTPA